MVGMTHAHCGYFTPGFTAHIKQEIHSLIIYNDLQTKLKSM
jgi:hypothetical protein